MATRKRKAAGNVGTFEGRPVNSVEIIIRGTGDGLSDAMKVEAKILKVGESGYIVLEFDTIDIHHPAEDRTDPAAGGVRRVQVLKAGTATFIDDEVVERAIEAQRVKNERWAEEQQGVARLDGTDHYGDHLLGEHKERVPGCPECDREAALEADGQ